MIHLISSNGITTTPSITHYDTIAPAVSKCLRFIKNVLHLDVKLGTYDANSTSFKLITQMAETKKSIEFKGRIFIPVLRPNKDVWGFLEVGGVLQKPTPAQIRKAIQASKDMIEPELENPSSEFFNSEINYSVLVLESSLDGGHRMSSNVFYSEKYTSFINLTEWIQQDDFFSLKSLREFSDSLLFVPEVLSLTTKQRSILALYSMLPDQLKGSSLIVCTSASFEHLDTVIGDEKGFLSAFATKKMPFNKYIEKRHQF